jgi:hypothetical protein
MLNLKITTLLLYLLLAGGVGAGSMFFIRNDNTALADATAVMNCKAPDFPTETRRVEPRRHVETVNSGRDKEY